MYRFHTPDLRPAGLDAETRSPAGARPRAGPGWAEIDPSGQTASLDPEQLHHARRVLRLNDGDAVEVFDGAGLVGVGTLAGGRVRVESLRWHAPVTPRIEVAAATPKGGHADDMAVMLSQLGADRLIPLRSERSVVDPREGKLQRLRRAMVESARQCKRPYVMEVGPTSTLESVLEAGHALRLIGAPSITQAVGTTRGPLASGGPTEALPPRGTPVADVLVLIGPEGGWTEMELLLAERAGARRWSLGPNVLRIETAACAAVAVLRYLLR